MNICIGGYWHGSQLLKSHKSHYFIVKDKSSGETKLYKRFFIWFSGEKYTFWIENSLGYIEAKEKITFYLDQIK